MTALESAIVASLQRGAVIPAHPLALTAHRRMDERRQRALTRYYIAAGADGVAVGVHTTQFAIRRPGVDLLRPVLELVAEAISEEERPGGSASGRSIIRIAGAVGRTQQAVAEARLAADLGYHAVLLSLGALADASDDALVTHCAAVAEVMPVVGFYLQRAVGGRTLGRDFWTRFAAIPRVVAIKIAPFDRYATLDVIHGLAASGRSGEVALLTGNDDSIVYDLLTRFPVQTPSGPACLRIRGGLLGQWAVWTSRAVRLLRRVRDLDDDPGATVPWDLLDTAVRLTDANAALFDPAHAFAGSIPGIHEVLRRQGLLAGVWCLDPDERLSPGQALEIDRVCTAYPELADDEFVAEHLDEWLR